MRLKEQGLGRVIRIGDSAHASDIKQLNDAGIAIEGIMEEPGTNKENWYEMRRYTFQRCKAFFVGAQSFCWPAAVARQ